MTDMGRTHRVEIWTPGGKWSHGSWINWQEGYGTAIDRIERQALALLASEPAGSTAKVYRYVPHSTEPMKEIAVFRNKAITETE